MSIKLKVILGFLVVLAGFLLYRVGLVLNFNLSSANIPPDISAPLESNGSDDNVPRKDSDKDGLVDEEEVYFLTDPFNADTDNDGFKDGEEITSGCSPITPRPNDCIAGFSNEETNLTSMVGDFLAGGLLSGDLKDPYENPSFFGNIDKIKSQVYLDFEEKFVDKITIADLNISPDNSSTAVGNYLKKIETVLNKSLLRPWPDQIGELKIAVELYSISSKQKNQIFSSLSDLFSQNTLDLVDLEVPNGWQDLHLKLVNLTNRFSSEFKFMSEPLSDPLATFFSFEKLITEYQNAQLILDEFSSREQQI